MPDLEEFAALLTLVGLVPIERMGPLTTDELTAIQWADDILNMAGTVAALAGTSDVGESVIAVLSEMPMVARLVMAFAAQFREVVATADLLTITVDLGPGATIAPG